MIIHVVKEGDTMGSIADSYGVPVERLMLENDIMNPDKLVVGQSILIVYPKQTYTIQEGDTLQGIADSFGVSVMQLLRNNSYLSDRAYIYPGETIVISYADEKIGKFITNGYAYPFIDRSVLKKTLPYLAYITIYTYLVDVNAELNELDDTEIIQIAKSYGVMPIMMITGIKEGTQNDPEVAARILSDPQLQENLISNVLTVLKNKGYSGVNVSGPYFYPQMRQANVDFMEKLTTRIHNEGYIVFDTLSYNTFEVMAGVRYEDLQLDKLGKMFDGVMLMAYDWGVTMGIPALSLALDSISETLEYVINQIPPEKVFFGISNIGYVWQLPYVYGKSVGQSISYKSALELAYEYGAEIRFDNVSSASSFQYVSLYEYLVQIRDLRGLDIYLKMLVDLGLNAFAVWNIMVFSTQRWLYVNVQYELGKIE